MTIEHRTTREVTQPRDVVHSRLLELASLIRDEMPAMPPGNPVGRVLGIRGPIALNIHDRGPSRIDLETLQGRIRFHGSAILETRFDGGTDMTIEMSLRPGGISGRLLLGVGRRVLPGYESVFLPEMEQTVTRLAAALSVADADWSAKDVMSDQSGATTPRGYTPA